MLFCPRCSYSLKKDDQFCPGCKARNPVYKAPDGSNEPDILGDESARIHTATIDASGNVVATSKQISSLLKRYKDAYIVSRATVGFGGLIKSIGVLLAVGVLLIAFFIASQTSYSRDGGVVLGISVISGVFGIFGGILLYLLGVLVSAQGQILKASLDSAVNTSPFLTNEHRAKMMSLHESYTAGTYEANSNRICEVCGKQLSLANKIDSFGAPRCKEHLYTKNA